MSKTVSKTGGATDQNDDRSDSSNDSSALSSPPSLKEQEHGIVWDFAQYLPEGEADRGKVEAGLEASLHFAIKLLFHAYKEPRCNFVVSPLSTVMSMGILVVGSYGKTQKEILKAAFDIERLGEKEMHLLKIEFQRFINFIVLPNDEMTFKTTLYMNREVAPDPAFVKQLGRTFGAEVKQFVSREAINKEFKDATQGKVSKVLLHADRRSTLLLVNVLHLKPTWNIMFSDILSVDTFYIDEENAVNLLFMDAEAKLNVAYNSASCFTVVELPVHIGDLSFLIFLPDKGSTIENLFLESDDCLCETLTRSAHLTKMETKPIRLSIPRFALEHTRHLRNFLPAVGIDEAFSSGRANFYATTTNHTDRKVALTDVVLKTVLEITEEQCVNHPEYRMKPTDRVMDFIVNRPFFFALTSPFDSIRRLFLTFGYVKNPKECGATSPTPSEFTTTS